MKSVIGKWVFAMFIASFLLSGADAQQWTREVIGEGMDSYFMLIGDADNDDKNEIYSVVGDYCLVGYYFDPITLNWNKSTLFTEPIGCYNSVDGEISDADNDGISEIYISQGGGYELLRAMHKILHDDVTGTWNVTPLFEDLGWGPQVRIGDGDNDGLKEIYTQAWRSYSNQQIARFKFVNETWQLDTVNGDGFYGLAIGDGDNDGKNEVYAQTYREGRFGISQFKRIGGQWVETPLPSELGVIILIGDGDNDGKNEIYTSDWGVGEIYQLKFDGSTWYSSNLGIVGGLFRTSMRDGDNDGKDEIYAVIDNAIIQYKWNGFSWEQTLVGLAGDELIEDSTYSIVIGDGDNDGKTEIYAAGYNYTEDTISVYKFSSVAIGPGPVCGNNVCESEETESNSRFANRYKRERISQREQKNLADFCKLSGSPGYSKPL